MSNMVPVLIFDDDSQFPLLRSGQYTVGGQGCDVPLEDSDTLPVQAYLIAAGLKVMLKPEANAEVALNGQPIKSLTALNADDIITIGPHNIKFSTILKTAVAPAPIFPKSGKNPFALDDDLLQPIPSQPIPPVPQPVTSPAAPPVPRAVTQPARSEDDQTDDDDLINDVLEAEDSADNEVDYDDNDDYDYDDDGFAREQSPLQPISTGSTTQDEGDEASFTAYYPREFKAGARGSIIVYAHTAEALNDIVRDIRKFADELGGEVPRPRTAAKKFRVQEGTPITVEIESDELEFDPPTLTRRWNDEWTRFAFEFRTPDFYIGEQIIFHIVISVYGIEVARIPNCAIEILAASSAAAAEDNPLAYAQLTYEETRLYQRIFVSYSRRDVEVVEAYRRAQEAIGNEVFVDTDSIRSGEDWQIALANAIQEADVFQLFWSSESANSQHVRDEWDYALKYRCTDDGCRGFIRPVFWVKPMPVTPPAELQHLNFRYVPLGD